MWRIALNQRAEPDLWNHGDTNFLCKATGHGRRHCTTDDDEPLDDVLARIGIDDQEMGADSKENKQLDPVLSGNGFGQVPATVRS